MNVLIVYTHPEPTSFCAALKDTAAAILQALGHEVMISDLYAQNFNPVAGRHDFTTIRDPSRFHYQSEQEFASQNDGYAAELVRQQQRLLAADLLIPIYPMWHGGMPAMMKGWFERVCAYGVIYFDRRRFLDGLFVGRKAILAIPTGGTEERFSATGVYGEMRIMLHPVQRGIFEYLGFEALEPFIAYAAPRVGDDGRKRQLASWAQRLTDIATDTEWLNSLETAKRERSVLAQRTEDNPWVVAD